MKPKILIVIDSHNREYLPSLYLKHALEGESLECKITSKYSLGISYNNFKPDFVIIPKIHKIPHLSEIKKSSKVILMTAESFTGMKESIVSYTKLWETQNIDFCFSWGTFDKAVYEEIKLFPNVPTFVTGNPIIEPWYLNKKKEGGKKKIGITTSLRSMTHLAASQNPIEQIISMEDNGASGFFDPPNHAESWIAFEAAWLRIIYDLMKEFKSYEISIRPHPLEKKEYYQKFKDINPNVTISEHATINEWLDDVDFLLSFLSTSQLDAHVRGIKVISIKNLFPKSIIEGIPASLSAIFANFFPEPKDLNEVKSLIDSYVIKSSKIDTFLLDTFNYPTEKPSKKIVQQIKLLASSHVCNKVNRKVKLKPLQEFMSYLPMGAELFILLKDFKSTYLKGEKVAVSFCAHKILRNQKFKKQFIKYQNSDFF